MVVARDCEAVLQRFTKATTTRVGEVGAPSKVLAGWIKDDRFQLILRQRRPNSFMPMVEGRVDPTSTGCLIFLRYKLMPITRMYLVLWTIIALGSGLFLAIFYARFLISLASLGTVMLIHGIAWANFKIHHKPLRDVIFKVLA